MRFHGASTNDHNPLRDEDLTRIAKAMVLASEDAEYSNSCNSTVHDGQIPAAYVTGIGNGKIIFAKPGDSDDILPFLITTSFITPSLSRNKLFLFSGNLLRYFN